MDCIGTTAFVFTIEPRYTPQKVQAFQKKTVIRGKRLSISRERSESTQIGPQKTLKKQTLRGRMLIGRTVCTPT